MLGTGVGDHRHLAVTEYVTRRNVDVVRIRFFDLVDVGLDVLHVGQIFDGAFFAGGDDQPLFSYTQRNLGLARLEVDGLGQLHHLAGTGRHLNLDERLYLGLEAIPCCPPVLQEEP